MGRLPETARYLERRAANRSGKIFSEVDDTFIRKGLVMMHLTI